MMVSKRNLLFQGLLFRFHVKFRGCKQMKINKLPHLKGEGLEPSSHNFDQTILLTFLIWTSYQVSQRKTDIHLHIAYLGSPSVVNVFFPVHSSIFTSPLWWSATTGINRRSCNQLLGRPQKTFFWCRAKMQSLGAKKERDFATHPLLE